jgi:hypothetical protein
VVGTGPVLDHRQTTGVSGYVRAVLTRRDGADTHRTFTNPFGFATEA